MPFASVKACADRLNGLNSAATKRGGIVWRCRSDSLLGIGMQVRHPAAVDGGRQPDVEVQSEWSGDLVGEESAERAPLRIHLADEFGLRTNRA